MNKLALTIAAIAIAGGTMLSSCGGDKKGNTAVASDTEAAAAATSNIRFYNLDSITTGYKLVEKLDSALSVLMTTYQNEERRRVNEIQRLAAQYDEKARNNGYLTQASYEQDMQNLQTKQNQAQQYLAGLQQQIAQMDASNKQELLDSITNFLRDYNAERGYDAIFVASLGCYTNPALDITQEVVDGLNQRYDGATAAPAPAAAPTAEAAAQN